MNEEQVYYMLQILLAAKDRAELNSYIFTREELEAFELAQSFIDSH